MRQFRLPFAKRISSTTEIFSTGICVRVKNKKRTDSWSVFSSTKVRSLSTKDSCLMRSGNGHAIPPVCFRFVQAAVSGMQQFFSSQSVFRIAYDPDGKCNGVHHLFFISDLVALGRLAKVLHTLGRVFRR